MSECGSVPNVSSGGKFNKVSHGCHLHYALLRRALQRTTFDILDIKMYVIEGSILEQLADLHAKGVFYAGLCRDPQNGALKFDSYPLKYTGMNPSAYNFGIPCL